MTPRSFVADSLGRSFDFRGTIVEFDVVIERKGAGDDLVVCVLRRSLREPAFDGKSNIAQLRT
jgi:hypothetical protein